MLGADRILELNRFDFGAELLKKITDAFKPPPPAVETSDGSMLEETVSIGSPVTRALGTMKFLTGMDGRICAIACEEPIDGEQEF